VVKEESAQLRNKSWNTESTRWHSLVGSIDPGNRDGRSSWFWGNFKNPGQCERRGAKMSLPKPEQSDRTADKYARAYVSMEVKWLW
jgi:hypothetical protein